MEKYDNHKLRSTQFPYHLTNPPKLTKLTKASSLKKLDNTKHADCPTTYMVINFDEHFVDSVPSEMPPIMRVDEKKTKQILAKLKKGSPEKPEQSLLKAPKLVNSYVLPKKVDPDAEAQRLMFRRRDTGTQTELNMNKLVFSNGLTGYQSWTSEVVEPFLKVRSLLMLLTLVGFPVQCALIYVRFTGLAQGSESQATAGSARLHNTILSGNAERRAPTGNSGRITWCHDFIVNSVQPAT
jgi:hypothetical protein